jgi:hypothetical protein
VDDDRRLRELVLELPRHLVAGVAKQSFGAERNPQTQRVTEKTILVTRAEQS